MQLIKPKHCNVNSKIFMGYNMDKKQKKKNFFS